MIAEELSQERGKFLQLCNIVGQGTIDNDKQEIVKEIIKESECI